MMRLIDADELKLELKWLEIDKPVYHDVMSTIDEIATVEPKHGNWTDRAKTILGLPTEACSECAEWSVGYKKDYCPNCGAKMDEVEDETN